MEKLKEKTKHDHLFTKILKVSIFALVMLAPMFAVAAKCMYVTFNKNAKDSYYGETINEEIINYYDINSLQKNNDYYIHVNNLGNSNLQNVEFKDLYVSNVVDLSEQYDFSQVNEIQLLTRANSYSSAYMYANNTLIKELTFTTTYDLIIHFRYLKTDNRTNTFFNDVNVFYQIEYNDYSYIDNVFYYSVEQIGNEQIFSWTKNTGIYVAINTMTTGLGIDPTNNILAVLLTYWSLITAVYIIIDIVIEMFVRLTHLLA